MAIRKSKARKISLWLGIFISFVVIVLLALSMDKINFKDNPLLGIAFWLLVIRGILLGTAIQNVNYIMGLPMPSVFSYIPYIQVVVVNTTKSLKIMYLLFPTLALIIMGLGSWDPLMKHVTYANVEQYFVVLQGVSLSLMLLWRLTSGHIFRKLLADVCDTLDEKTQSPSGPFFNTIKILAYVTAYLPALSLLTYVTLLNQSYVLRGIKEKEIATKAASQRGGTI